MATRCHPPSDSTATGNLETTEQVLKNVLLSAFLTGWAKQITC